jgi:hypothetical protein
MEDDVAVHPRSTMPDVDAILEAFWGDPEELSRAERRRRDFELKVRAGAAEHGEEPAAWWIDQIRSGEWFRRQRQIRRAVLSSMASRAMAKVDAAFIAVQPAPDAEPREPRSVVRATGSARDGPSRSDDDPPEPDLDRLPGFRVASSRMFAHVGRRLAAERAA